MCIKGYSRYSTRKLETKLLNIGLLGVPPEDLIKYAICILFCIFIVLIVGFSKIQIKNLVGENFGTMFPEAYLNSSTRVGKYIFLLGHPCLLLFN